MAKTITLGPAAGTVGAVRGQTVYTRANWIDDWVLNATLTAVQATWSVAPSIPSATLVFDYGRIREPGPTATFEDVSKLAIGRNYVRIVYQSEGDSWDWVGFVDIDSDEIFGTDKFGGRQTIIAYGIEKLLADHVIDRTVWGTTSHGETTVYKSGPAGLATFNKDGRGNRHKTIGPAPENAFIFGMNASSFYRGREELKDWNSSQIIEHLLAWHTPRDEADSVKVVINYTSDNIATWDQPILPTEQSTTYSLISQLIDRRRLLVWWLAYNSEDDVMDWKAASLASADITLTVPGEPKFLENANKIDLDFDQDQYTRATVRREFDKFHKVIARGARRISVGLFLERSMYTFSTAWTDDEEIKYEEAASGTAGYDAMSRDEQQKRNAEVRSDPSLARVYSTWRINERLALRDAGPHFNRSASDFDGGSEFFPGDPDFYYPEATILPSLPLLAGIDYSGSVTDAREAEKKLTDREEISPILFMHYPPDDDYGKGRWILGEEFGQGASTADEGVKASDWSVSVSVPIDSHEVVIKVIGKPQYFLVRSEGGAPLPDDIPAETGIGKQFMIAIAMLDPRYAEGVVDTGIITDVSRTKVLWLGESYRQIYIAKGTPVGVDEDGKFKDSDGGYLHDDTDLLESIALIAADYYTIDRKVLNLRTTRILDSTTIGLGYMIQNIGHEDGSHAEAINSVITQIDIQSPMGDLDTDPPEMRITTWAGELDAFAAERSDSIEEPSPRFNSTEFDEPGEVE